MTTPQAPRAKPLFLVCEDGSEYHERFERFLGSRYDFIQARSASELVDLLGAPARFCAVLLDLDFRRTELAHLIDGAGAPLLNSSGEERKRLIANQGIAILAYLRKRYAGTPVLLFADLAESQVGFLVERFAPLRVVPSHVSMRELQVELDDLALQSP
jgi:hypothetical protein